MNKFIPVCEPMLAGNELKYVTDAVSTGWISSSGSYVAEFEKAFSAYCGCNYGVAVTNGTVAIHLALVALGIGKGDEVIIPSFTMIATAFACCYIGAVPVFVDADENTWNMNIDKIEQVITKKTKAIIPVHIFGNPCNMGAITEIAKKHSLFIIEDAAEAHGALWNEKKVGSFSDIASFSFFANKNLTTGEGGMVVMNEKKWYDNCRYYKNMCFPLDAPRLYLHDNIGYNYRMSNLHAAIGLAQCEKAEYYKNLRINNSDLYKSELSACEGIILQEDEPNSLNVHWMNAIIIDPIKYGHTRDDLISELAKNKIETRLLFNGMHRQLSLKKYGCQCDNVYPNTDNLSDNGMYLPSASSLIQTEILHICSIIKNFRR